MTQVVKNGKNRQNDQKQLKRTVMHNIEKFEQFRAAYQKGLTEAVRRFPEEYAYKLEDVSTVVILMMNNMVQNPNLVNFRKEGFRRACKELKIRCSKKAILDFIEWKAPEPQRAMTPEETELVELMEASMARVVKYRRQIQIEEVWNAKWGKKLLKSLKEKK